MKLSFKGQANNFFQPIVGKVTRDIDNAKNKILILDDLTEFKSLDNPLALLSAKENKIPNTNEIQIPTIFNLVDLNDLKNDDIAVLNPNGNIRTLFQAESLHNSLFVTDRCNSNCLMCSQPPKNREDIPYFYSINSKLVKLLPKELEAIGITGGEPTLMGEKLGMLISQIKDELPDTDLQILTNGRAFAWQNYTKLISSYYNDNVIFAVPLYSDYYSHHDYIVQAEDAFNQTLLGLHNMARYNFKIEIRIVLHKQSIERLYELSKFIYQTLPFVDHIAFMGLEYTGYTPFNHDLLWIDPVEYQAELQKSVTYLKQNLMNVSIYNLQLCLLPSDLWKYSKKSISDWKQSYLDECNKCTIRDDCGGVFETSKIYSKNIKAFESSIY